MDGVFPLPEVGPRLRDENFVLRHMREGSSGDSGRESRRLIFPGIASDGIPEPEPAVSASAVSDTVAIPEPTAAPEPPGIPRQFNGGVEQWRPLVASIFPAWAVDTVLAVMWCESRGDPNATGAAGERGLLQIHPRWHYDATYDPEGNLRAAYRISSGGTDWSAWTCAR